MAAEGARSAPTEPVVIAATAEHGATVIFVHVSVNFCKPLASTHHAHRAWDSLTANGSLLSAESLNDFLP